MSKNNSSEFFIDPGVFKGIELHFNIENTTTRTTVGHSEKIILVQFLEQGMVLEIPAKSCSSGHNLVIKITVSGSSVIEEFEATAKVAEHEATSKETETIVASLTQFDGEHWSKLQSVFSARQEEIEKFFTSARGW